jgi:alkylated DNA nucleotide flippase Atl1
VDFEVYVAEVLDIVDAIPAGRVMAYGEVAHCLGRGGPRQVGRVMAVHGGAVAWWRVIRADGQAAQGLERAALKQWRAEGTPLRADGRRVDMARARWAGEPSDLG